MSTNDPNNWIKCPKCGTPCYAPTAHGICAKCNLLVWPDGRTAPANLTIAATRAVSIPGVSTMIAEVTMIVEVRPEGELAAMERKLQAPSTELVAHYEQVATEMDGETTLAIHARAVVDHWNEFGPQHGFAEKVDALAGALPEPSDEQVAANLKAAGIDMRPAYERMHRMVEAHRANRPAPIGSLNRTHIGWMMRGLANWLDGDNGLSPTERQDAEATLELLRSMLHRPAPNCPKCGTEMGPQTAPNDEANAHLIAAAPDLLKAAKLVADCSVKGLCESCRNRLNAAIAKAEGQS